MRKNLRLKHSSEQIWLLCEEYVNKHVQQNKNKTENHEIEREKKYIF